eukprot:scaffold49967_cov47-Prasinocladus_malaysianus.AAC.1
MMQQTKQKKDTLRAIYAPNKGTRCQSASKIKSAQTHTFAGIRSSAVTKTESPNPASSLQPLVQADNSTQVGMSTGNTASGFADDRRPDSALSLARAASMKALTTDEQRLLMEAVGDEV